MKIKLKPEDIFSEYEKCREYDKKIDLIDTVEKNENFYIGKQWEGINAPDLEKPVLNFLKRVVGYFISMIVSDDVGINIEPYDAQYKKFYDVVSDKVSEIIERTKIKQKNRNLLRNSAVDGDCVLYFRFNKDIETADGDVRGDIDCEIINNTDVHFGNPYENELQKQPYIIISKRVSIEQAMDETKDKSIRGLITPDNDKKIYGENADDELVTILYKFWRQEGKIYFLKCTRNNILQNPVCLDYKLYPIAYMSWEHVKNSYRGQAALTGLIYNQIYVNKLWAMFMEYHKRMAFPIIFYNQNIIGNMNNKIGRTIGIQGNPNEAFLNSFKSPDFSSQAMALVEKTISMTRDFLGASDAALGNVKPDNTSAIIAVQKASSAPLELQRQDFFQFIEDYIRIIIDIMRVTYGVRKIPNTDENGNFSYEYVDFNNISQNNMQLNIDIGSSSYFSELAQMQTLDKLFEKGILSDSILYLKSIPDKYIKNKNEIIKSIEQKIENEQNEQNTQSVQNISGDINVPPEMQPV